MGEQTPGGESLSRSPRLVLFSVGDSQYDDRTARRCRILAMRPVDPTETAASPKTAIPEDSGAYWEFLQADDSPLLVRASDLPSRDDARTDAAWLFAHAAQLRTVYVRDHETGRLAWWLVLDDQPVLVPARVWRAPQRRAVVLDAKRALAALARMPQWGEYCQPR